MEQTAIKVCRHKNGTINGICIDCGTPIKLNHIKYSFELGRMLRTLEVSNMEKKEVINFGNLEHYIKKIEWIFEEESVNPTEQSLILTHTLNRLNKRLRNTQAQDMIQNIPLGGLMNRLIKSKDKE